MGDLGVVVRGVLICVAGMVGVGAFSCVCLAICVLYTYYTSFAWFAFFLDSPY